jgi:hypothetical protein
MFGEKAPAHHPAAVSTAKFCIQEIEKSGGEAARSKGRWRGSGSSIGELGVKLFVCQVPKRPPPRCIC